MRLADLLFGEAKVEYSRFIGTDQYISRFDVSVYYPQRVYISHSVQHLPHVYETVCIADVWHEQVQSYTWPVFEDQTVRATGLATDDLQ